MTFPELIVVDVVCAHPGVVKDTVAQIYLQVGLKLILPSASDGGGGAGSSSAARLQCVDVVCCCVLLHNQQVTSVEVIGM